MAKHIKSMADYRREYGDNPLTKATASADPIEQFKIWFEDILITDNYDPTAMLLSTVDDKNQPDARVVLLKGVENGEFIFFTNYESAKAKQIKQSSKVCLSFFWPFLSRQVRIKGAVTKLAEKESDTYFSKRPRLSQIAAIASPQSSTLCSREELEEKMHALIDKYSQEAIRRPKNWGGYKVNPSLLEFWQGRDNRLHDRLCYSLSSKGSWDVSRLAP